MLFKLAPGDLTYLYSSCKRCFWRKCHGTQPKIFTPIPGVFRQIDSLMRHAYQGKGTELISPDLPPGVIDTRDRKLTSIPITPDGCTNQVQISGRLDAQLRFADMTCGVGDFKCSQLDEARVQMYAPQLHGYAIALEFPQAQTPERVTHLGLFGVYPELYDLVADTTISLKMKSHWFAVPYRPDWFMHVFLKEVTELLSENIPAAADNCSLCSLVENGVVIASA